jgi:hypothetical protein
MFRIRAVKLAAVSLLCTTGLAFAEPDTRRNLWIGTHLLRLEEYSQQIKVAVGKRLSLLENEIDMSDKLERHYRAHKVRIDDSIGTLRAELEFKYNLDSEKALMVMAGSGTEKPSEMLSVVYVGPPSNKFEIDVTGAKLLSTEDQPSALEYIKLLFLYAMIKEADAKELNFQTYIAPLLDEALSLTWLANESDPKMVEKIRNNLTELTPQ